MLRSTPLRTVLAVIAFIVSSASWAADPFIMMASTTSTENSGLFKFLLPKFKAQTGIDVRVIAQGTGQALETARRGDVDILFVHNRRAEEHFVAAGFGLPRRDVMYNDFVIVGPNDDPAHIQGRDVSQAMATLAQKHQPFFSRGDDSGTHSAEKRYWAAAKVSLKTVKGGWYRETGSGMGATLNVASASNGYALTDRGTWLNFKNRGELKILVQGDARLFNPYGVIVVNPEKHRHVKIDLARRFSDWIVSAQGQQVIAEYKINGQQAFFPNAQ